MRVRITVAAADDAAALYEWLRADQGLARRAEVAAGPPAPGHLGVLEIIDVVLTQATAVSSLALAVAGWRHSRRGRASVTITRADGATLTVEGPPEHTGPIIERFLAGGGSGENRGGSGESRGDGGESGGRG